MAEDLRISDSKIIIIYGEENVDGENKNGSIEIIKKQDGDTPKNKNSFPHYSYMNNFLKTHFKDSSNLQRYAKTRDINVLLFLLANEGHITMTETSYPKHKSALVTMPRKCTEEQKQILKQLQEKLKDENYMLSVIYNYKLEDGIITGKEVYGDANVLNQFIEIIKQKDEDEMEL